MSISIQGLQIYQNRVHYEIQDGGKSKMAAKMAPKNQFLQIIQLFGGQTLLVICPFLGFLGQGF